MSVYSKLLNNTNQSLSTLNTSYGLTLNKGKASDNSNSLLFGTLKFISTKRIVETPLVGNITELESKYLNSIKLSNMSRKNSNMSLNTFANVTSLLKGSTGFDFNIHTNLLTAQQQR